VHLLATTGERVLVIGAAGALGSITARVFENAGWEVFRGGRDIRRDGVWRRVDLDQPVTIRAALEGVDIVVNTVPHTDVAAERFVIEHGGVLLNTSALSVASVEPLGALGRTAIGTVVVGAGIAPGLTTLVAAELLAAHPETDEIELVFTFSASATAGPNGLEFVHRHLTARTRHDTVEVPLPSPFGTRQCIGFAEPERAWIGDLAGPRAVRSYACFAEQPVHDSLLARNERDGFADFPRPASTVRAPADRPTVSREPVAHWVCVRRGNLRIAAKTIRCAGDYLGAAQATLALAHALQDARAHRFLTTGVFGPEGLVELSQLNPYLATAGITVVAQPV
jgi:hypothetical protein